ncbi:MAG: type IV pilus modification PilV family protein [Pirellulales bacterium]
MKRHQQATTTYFTIRTDLQRTAACREGFTILEVLISAGIMVIGLACVASLLPAAAQRMSQAVSEDRAGTLAANAYADITTRRPLGLLSPSQLDSDYGVAKWNRGEIFAFGMVKTSGANPKILHDEIAKYCDNYDATVHAVDWSVADVNGNRLQIFPTSKTWVIEDALTFNDSGGAPVNTFDSDGSRPNPMCWLATVVPDGVGAARAGDAATVSLAIFKKQPDEQGMRSGYLNAGVLQIKDNSNVLVNVDDDTRRQFVKGCGSVLALGSTPEWIRINASWTDANGTHLICDSSYSGDVVLFTNLLRVEKHRVVLD